MTVGVLAGGVGGAAWAWHNAISMERTFHVYLMASKSGVLYLGVTGKLAQRVFEHRESSSLVSRKSTMSPSSFGLNHTPALAPQFPARKKSKLGAEPRK
jgi:hypothetical protein